MAKIDVTYGRFSKAVKQLLQAEKLVLELDNLKVLEDIYSLLAETKIKTTDFKSASLYQGKLLALKDSIYNLDLTNNLTALEVDYVERENQLKVESQAALLTSQQETINMQQLMLLAFSFAGALLVTLLLVLWKLLRTRSRINLLLTAKVNERTKELSQRIGRLEEAQSQEVNSLRLAVSSIRKDVASLQGLCELALNEIDDLLITKELESRFRKVSSSLSGALNIVLESENPL